MKNIDIIVDEIILLFKDELIDFGNTCKKNLPFDMLTFTHFFECIKDDHRLVFAKTREKIKKELYDKSIKDIQEYAKLNRQNKVYFDIIERFLEDN